MSGKVLEFSAVSVYGLTHEEKEGLRLLAPVFFSSGITKKSAAGTLWSAVYAARAAGVDRETAISAINTFWDDESVEDVPVGAQDGEQE